MRNLARRKENLSKKVGKKISLRDVGLRRHPMRASRMVLILATKLTSPAPFQETGNDMK